MPLRLYVSLLSYLAVPGLVVVAYRDWMKRMPESRSSWRNRLGLTSMLVISVDWCSIIFLIIAAKANLRIDDSWFDYLSLAAIVATFLAIALKGTARICTVAAGLSMGLFFATSWVE